MNMWEEGRYKEASAVFCIQAERYKDTGDELMWRLEEGLSCFEAGEYTKSLAAFERAETIIRDFENRAEYNVRAGSAEVASAMTNPNAIPYRGFCYDKYCSMPIKPWIILL